MDSVIHGYSGTARGVLDDETVIGLQLFQLGYKLNISRDGHNDLVQYINDSIMSLYGK
jgi:hypothetical protein